jgi:hypothetical protein
LHRHNPETSNQRDKNNTKNYGAAKEHVRGTAEGDGTLGEELADGLVGVHAAVPQRRVDLRVGAADDLLEPLH